MTFHQMEIFISVCDAGSISKAAELNSLSQQGVSRMIRELEMEVGCPLLLRQAQGVLPTQRGQYFYSECKKILLRKTYLCSNLSLSEFLQPEHISIGMAYGVVSVISYKRIAQFTETHSDVHISYEDHTDDRLEALLKKEEYQFCFTTGINDADRFDFELIAEESVYLAIPSPHELWNEYPITMDTLRTQHFAMFSTQFHLRRNFVRSCQSYGFEPIIDVASNDLNSIIEIARQNNLLFVAPSHCISNASEGILYRPFPDPTLKWQVYFAKKKNHDLSENAKELYRFLIEK